MDTIVINKEIVKESDSIVKESDSIENNEVTKENNEVSSENNEVMETETVVEKETISTEVVEMEGVNGEAIQDKVVADSINDSEKEIETTPITDITNSTSTPVVSNKAKRGTKRKIGEADIKPTREVPRRTTRSTRRSYAEEISYTEVEEEIPDDPDYKMSDSDEDPDFDPISRSRSPEEELNRSRRGKGRGRPRPSRGSGHSNRSSLDSVPVASTEETEANKNGENSTANADYISDNTVSSTDDTKTSNLNLSNLSSSYNYAASRSRQNAAIRLPEGPNLTEEQLKQIESQFKSGDFVMAKKDSDMIEHPPIWRIDGKSLLQKFQAFDKDGKMLYRNISTYSGWTPQAKALYVPVKVNFVFQSRYDTVVELIGFKGAPGVSNDTNVESENSTPDRSSWIAKSKNFEISDEHRVHMPSFEIYLQTLISQALDNNFLTEIYDENDAYFVDRVKMIDELTDERKNKILKMAEWKDNFQASLDTWPCVNTMLTKNTGMCQACDKVDATKLSQFYGQPYDNKTLRSKEPTFTDLENKNFQTCDSCAELSETYNKVCHQKYDYYSQCKSTVTNMRVTQPNKTTTNVLRDLLANDEWITGLFRSMCTMWIKVDGIYEKFTKKSKDSDDVQKDATVNDAESGEKIQPVNENSILNTGENTVEVVEEKGDENVAPESDPIAEESGASKESVVVESTELANENEVERAPSVET